MVHEWVRIGVAVSLPHLGGMAYSVCFPKSVYKWYNDKLIKPDWTPPNWLYLPVGLSLYSAMGYASYLVWRDAGGFRTDKGALALGLYGTQLALNWYSSKIFFSYKRLGWATIELGLTTSVLGATMFMFNSVNKTAAYLLAPSLAWCSFATFLCYSIWNLNKEKDEDQ